MFFDRVFIKLYEIRVALFGQLFLLELLVFVHARNQNLIAVLSRLLCRCDHFSKAVAGYTFFDQVCDLFRLSWDLEAVFHHQQDDTLKADRKSARRNVLSG